ncbi:hypothetical protein GQ53DRAFT_838309 [Thozetella sp. PMI_491]|nr:hypothetical protein GQ53DRAFT_838309 [Thozetella sp. PMI_491]
MAKDLFERAECLDSIYTDPGTPSARIRCMRSFGLVTAVCAATSLVHQKCCLHFGDTTGPLFLEAARRMLREYEDHDIQNPDSSSLQIRMLLSTCFQHYAGENALAWHVVSQAGLIARQMCLYTEKAVMQHDPLESTLLRLSFWTLHMADSTAACVQNRGVVLQESLFNTSIDLEEFGLNQVPLIDTDSVYYEEGFERSLLSGFHTMRRLWTVGAKLMLAIRAYGRDGPVEKRDGSSVTENDIQHISELYAEVLGALDTMPPSLQSAISAPTSENAMEAYRASCYTSQRFRLLSAYHSLKLMMIYQCGQHGLVRALGFREEPAVITMEKIRTARDYIHNLQSVPFHYIKCNGETGAELMRVVGSALLEICQNSPDAQSRQQADALLSMLLNILARFDSRALSESLQQRTNSGVN